MQISYHFNTAVNSADFEQFIEVQEIFTVEVFSTKGNTLQVAPYWIDNITVNDIIAFGEQIDAKSWQIEEQKLFA